MIDATTPHGVEPMREKGTHAKLGEQRVADCVFHVDCPGQQLHQRSGAVGQPSEGELDAGRKGPRN